MLVGVPPFYTTSINIMYEKILKQPVVFPSFVSDPAKGVIEEVFHFFF